MSIEKESHQGIITKGDLATRTNVLGFPTNPNRCRIQPFYGARENQYARVVDQATRERLKVKNRKPNDRIR